MSVLTPQAERELSEIVEAFGAFDAEVSESTVVIALARVLRASLGRDDRGDDLTPTERRLLVRGGFDLTPRSLGASDPFLRGAGAYLTLLTTSLTTRAAATLLGVNESRIRQRCGEDQRTLYGIKWRREWRLPRFQFWENGEVPHIDRVLPRLRQSLDPVSVERWFTLPNDELPDGRGDELSPRGWLISGRDYAPVTELAAEL